MTKVATSVSHLSEGAQRASTFLEEFRRALQALVSILRSCERLDAEPLLLFDTDVTYSLLPSVTAREMMASRGDTGRTVGLLGRLCHTHTLTSFVRSSPGLFALPPGTCTELERRRVSALEGQTKIARSLVRVLDSTSSETLPRDLWMRLRASSQNGDAIMTHLCSVIEYQADLEFVDLVFANSADLASILQTDPGTEAQQAYATVLSQLSTARPLHSDNNFCDAVNVATAVHVLARACRSRTTQRRMPVLVSNTSLLLRNPRFPAEFVSSTSDSPELVANALFPTLLTALPSRFGADRTGTADNDFVEQLLADCEALYDLCRQLTRELRHQQDKIDLDWKSAIDASPELAYMWRRALHEAEAFRERWFEIVAPLEHQGDLDRVMLINRLSLQSVWKMTGDEDEAQVVRHLSRIRRMLQEREVGTRNLWELLRGAARQRPVDISRENSGVAARVHLVLSEDLNPSYELCSTGIGRRLDVEARSDSRTSRIVVHHSLDSRLGALLAMDVEDHSDGAYVRLSWPHRDDGAKVWREGARLLSEWYVDEDYLDYKLWFLDRCEASRSYLPNSEATYLSLNAPDANLDYFEQVMRRVVHFADVLPLDSGEMQQGVLFPLREWSSVRHELIERCVASAVDRIPAVIWREALNQLRGYCADGGV